MLSRVMSTAEAFLRPVLALQPGCRMPQLQYHRGAPLCWPVVGLGLPKLPWDGLHGTWYIESTFRGKHHLDLLAVAFTLFLKSIGLRVSSVTADSCQLQ
jgi:hypothetical protein